MEAMMLSDFLAELKDCAAEIIICIRYANSMLTSSIVPMHAKKRIRNTALKCKDLVEKYDRYLNMEPGVEFEKKTIEIAQNFRGEMVFVYDFFTQLDNDLMTYGFGPTFERKHHFMHTVQATES